MGLTVALLAVLSIYPAITPLTAQPFKCSTAGATCNALVGYVAPNATTLGEIKSLFGIKNLRTLLGANNFPPSTLPSAPVAAKSLVKIPFECRCSNGTGAPSTRRPIYKVAKDDTLYHIAAEVFSGLVTYQQIQVANKIKDANLIEVGRRLWIPIPCSCDELEGERVVYYAHVVQPGSTVEEIAQEYGASPDTLLRLNGLSSSKDLKALTPFEVPLKACSSMVGNNSLDYPLLAANGTYFYTAGNCVKCSCDAAANWTLKCEPSQVKSSLWQTCPSMQCEGAGSFYVGNTTISNCNRTSCAYAGYNNQTILTTLSSESTCPVSEINSALKTSLGGLSWSYLLVSVHLVVVL
ncbi:hypothetical protein NMG60_11019899, partial [Bertholletia excelsa]